METFGWCKLCGKDLVLRNYTIVKQAKDFMCVISDGRVHEIVTGHHRDVAMKKAALANLGLREYRLYTRPIENLVGAEEESESLSDRDAPGETR